MIAIASASAMACASACDETAIRFLYRTLQPKILTYVRAIVGETDEKTSHPKPGAESPATSTHSAATETASTPGPPPSPDTAPSTTSAEDAPVTPLSPEDIPHQPARNDPAREAITAIDTTTALAIIAELPTDQAQAILLRVVVGLDAPTAGKVLGKRPGAVRTATYRGLRNLAKRLSPLSISDDGERPPARLPWARRHHAIPKPERPAMTDEHSRWDGNPESVDHFLQIVARSDVSRTDRLTSVLAAAASSVGHTDPHGEERFLAEYHAAKSKPTWVKPQYLSLRIAIPVALATLTITGGIAVATNLPSPPSASPRPQTTAITSTSTSMQQSAPTATHQNTPHQSATPTPEPPQTQTSRSPHGRGHCKNRQLHHPATTRETSGRHNNAKNNGH